MRHFVPERRFPLELARRPGFRGIHRDHAPEADAERAGHAGQPERSDGEVVVLRKNLDQDRALDGETVARGDGLERLPRDPHRVVTEHRRLVLVHLQDDVVARLDRHELVERVHHLQQVERDHVEGIGLERRLERNARGGLITRSEQVQAEVSERPRAPRVELQGAARQRHRLLEPVVAGEQRSGHPVDVAVARGDRQHLVSFDLELVEPVFDIGQAREERSRLEARGVDGQRLLEQLPGLRALAGIDRLICQKDVCRDVGRIDLEHFLRERDGLRRVLFRQRARRPEQSRRPPGIHVERGLERLHGLADVIGLQEQLAPAGVDRRIARRSRHRIAVGGVGVFELVERAQRARLPGQLRGGGAPGRRRRRHHAVEDRGRVGPAEQLEEQAKFERRVAAGGPLCRRAERRLRLLVASARDERSRR